MSLNEQQIEAIADHFIAVLRVNATDDAQNINGTVGAKLTTAEIISNLANTFISDGTGVWSIRRAMADVAPRVAGKLRVQLKDVDWDTMGPALDKAYVFSVPVEAVAPKEAAKPSAEGVFRAELVRIISEAKEVVGIPDVFVIRRADIVEAMIVLENNPKPATD